LHPSIIFWIGISIGSIPVKLVVEADPPSNVAVRIAPYFLGYSKFEFEMKKVLEFEEMITSPNVAVFMKYSLSSHKYDMESASKSMQSLSSVNCLARFTGFSVTSSSTHTRRKPPSAISSGIESSTTVTV